MSASAEEAPYLVGTEGANIACNLRHATPFNTGITNDKTVTNTYVSEIQTQKMEKGHKILLTYFTKNYSTLNILTFV